MSRRTETASIDMPMTITLHVHIIDTVFMSVYMTTNYASAQKVCNSADTIRSCLPKTLLNVLIKHEKITTLIEQTTLSINTQTPDSPSVSVLCVNNLTSSQI